MGERLSGLPNSPNDTRANQRRGLLVFLALLFAFCNLLDNDVKPPPGQYQTINIPGGSLRVSRGSCEAVDLLVIENRATVAVRNMRNVWQNVYPIETITVDASPVVMSVNPTTSAGQANGIYHPAERWIELRCEKELVIEAEIYHAIAHRLGIFCWKTIGHGVRLDCNPG